jgi:hypothetical protein
MFVGVYRYYLVDCTMFKFYLSVINPMFVGVYRYYVVDYRMFKFYVCWGI